MLTKTASTLALTLVLLVVATIFVQELNGAPLNDTLDLKIDGKAECVKYTGWSPDQIEVSTTYNDG